MTTKIMSTMIDLMMMAKKKVLRLLKIRTWLAVGVMPPVAIHGSQNAGK